MSNVIEHLRVLFRHDARSTLSEEQTILLEEELCKNLELWYLFSSNSDKILLTGCSYANWENSLEAAKDKAITCAALLGKTDLVDDLVFKGIIGTMTEYKE